MNPAEFQNWARRVVATDGVECELIQMPRFEAAAVLGYLDARTQVHFKETYGLPLSDSCRIAVQNNLRIDWCGLHTELLLLGMDDSSASAELDEAKFFVRELERAS